MPCHTEQSKVLDHVANEVQFVILQLPQSHFRMSGKPTVQSYGHGTESKKSIQPIIAIRMLGHCTVTASLLLYFTNNTVIRAQFV